MRCVEIAFSVTRKLEAQSMAFDFVFDEEGEPKIVEVSYCYVSNLVHQCSGYWDSKMNWNEGNLWPEDAILADVLNQINK